MSLYTKCILDVPLPNRADGVRVSVMSRHTLSDGKTQDSRIKESMFDIHSPILAPSPRLIGDYYQRGLGWGTFESRYLEELRSEPKLSWVVQLGEDAIHQDITILCIEDYARYCHRRLLAEECKRLRPILYIEHR
jgi:uncharacterized protein YeaO (DUF488 family)